MRKLKRMFDAATNEKRKAAREVVRGQKAPDGEVMVAGWCGASEVKAAWLLTAAPSPVNEWRGYTLRMDVEGKCRWWLSWNGERFAKGHCFGDLAKRFPKKLEMVESLIRLHREATEEAT